MLDMASNPPGTRESRPVEMTASINSTVSKFKQIGTCFHADIHTFRAKTSYSHFDVDSDERLGGSHCITAPIKKNRFKSVCKKFKRWIKKTL